MTVKEAKRIKLSSPSPALDLNCFLQELTGFDKTKLLLNQDALLTSDQENTLLTWCSLREKGLPVSYILNKRDFYGRTFYVDQNVLIPKPDTEILVERAIEILNTDFESKEGDGFSVADICTGSGCIGLSVLLENGNKIGSITMTDISSEALNVAKKNAEGLVTEDCLSQKISFVSGDLMENLGTFDLILSNPPYVPKKLCDELLQDGRGEPLLALDGDVDSGSDDGLALPKRLLNQIKEHLNKNGIFLMELGEYNIEKARDYAGSVGFSGLVIHKDLEGQLRVLEGRLQD